MPISLMSARLFENAFRTGDFTGWPDWIRMDDGMFTTSLMLSVVGTERNCYSVIVKTDDPGSQRFVFLLNVEQMNEKLKHLTNRFPIKDVLLMEKDETGRDLGSRKRMAVQIDYGEHFVLDVVERPAMRAFDPSTAAFSAEGDGTEEEEEAPAQDDDGSSGSMMSRMAEKAGIRKIRKEKEERARSNMPPKDRTLFRWH